MLIRRVGFLIIIFFMGANFGSRAIAQTAESQGGQASLEIGRDDDGRTFAKVDDGRTVAKVAPVDVNIEKDLDERVEAGDFAPSDVASILSEMRSIEGARYEIPDLATLKDDLGFPDDVEFAEGDLAAMVEIDLQTHLGVSRQTARYLALFLSAIRHEPEASATQN